MSNNLPIGAGRAGFTLLEVLAAIALLGIVFTALSRSASMGVISEGRSRNLLEASVLADSQLAILELAIAAGEVPALGVEELEVDDFLVTIETLPFALPDALEEERDALISTPSTVFGDGSDTNAGAVREIRLSIGWPDAPDERSIERVTYAVDYAAINGLDELGGLSIEEMNRQVQEAVDAAGAR